MLRKHIACIVSALLLLLPTFQAAHAEQQTDKQAPSTEQIRIEVTRLGVGEKARATITLKNGSKAKGYISQSGDDDFVLRDRKTNSPTTIRYADVVRVQPDRGHSTAKHLGLGIGIGVGAFLAVLLIVFAHLQD